MKKFFAGLLSALLSLPVFAADPYYNVKDFGVKADGLSVETAAIQRVIDRCAAAGGGKVVFPAGTYLTGALFLRSHIEVEILSGATLRFDDNIAVAASVEGSWEGIERRVYASLFTGHDLVNVTISGRGTLDGQGKKWWDAYYQTEEVRKRHGIREREDENPEGSDLKYPRPRMINLYNCRNVTITGITLVNSPAWTVHPVYCENVRISGISIIQPYESPNTDGINPEACNNVRITDCFVDCGDDCITLKSGYNEHGRKKGIPCENIVISNCTFAHGRSAVGIGSEMSGGVRNVTITNCVFKGTLRGLRVKTGRPRGGVVENIRASNIIMENIAEGISIDMYYEADGGKVYPVTEETPFFRNIHFSNITGRNIKTAVNILGLPEAPVEQLTLADIYMEAEQGLLCRYATDATFRNVRIDTSKEGPVFRFVKTDELRIDNLSTRSRLGNTPMITLDRTGGAVISDCILKPNVGIFLKATDSPDVIFNNNLTGDAHIIQ